MRIKKYGINLYDTLFSGQCFRMEQEEDGSYTIVLSDRVINIKENENYLEVDSNVQDNLEEVIFKYLDFGRDYDFINSILSEKNNILKDNIELVNGYKILNQDKFEMYITYIISQNNNVKRIIKSVDKLSKMYGKKQVFRGKDYYLFPTFEEMKSISLEELREIGVGFRDVYIKNALERINNDRCFLDKLDNLSTEEALKELISIKGIGMKVASCILLFGYGRLDTFPIDTWVRHFVSKNYNVKDNIKDISFYMKNIFDDFSGLAIQYFYHIERNKNVSD